jgi:hypothetical protein
MRGEHLQFLSSPVGSPEAEVLAELVDMLCAGVVPSLLATGALYGIPKPNGEIRPIAAGELIRKVASKIALAELRSAVGDSLEAVGQFAMSAYGAHRVYATVRDAVAAGNFVASLDITNAFNSVERVAVIDAVKAATGPADNDPQPDADRPDQGAALVVALYSQPTTLYVADAQVDPIVSSRRGAH